MNINYKQLDEKKNAVIKLISSFNPRRVTDTEVNLLIKEFGVHDCEVIAQQYESFLLKHKNTTLIYNKLGAYGLYNLTLDGNNIILKTKSITQDLINLRKKTLKIIFQNYCNNTLKGISSLLKISKVNKKMSDEEIHENKQKQKYLDTCKESFDKILKNF